LFRQQGTRDAIRCMIHGKPSFAECRRYVFSEPSFIFDE
jgi:hypothetical protein